MRILIYSQFCTPEPIFKSVPFARELRRRGHDVRILTGFPNYPGGSVYPGYKLRLFQHELIDEVPILRVPLLPSHNNSVAYRMLNYMSFAATSTLPLWFGWRPEVVYVYNLVTLGFTALLNQTFRGIPFVIDVQDLWPDSVFQSGMAHDWMGAPLRALSRLSYRGASRVVTLSPGMAHPLVERGVEKGRIRTIYNWCDEQSLLGGGAPPDDVHRQFAGRFNVLFAGNMGLVQGLECVIEAAALVAKRAPKVQFVFMGNGVMLETLRTKARNRSPSNILFLSARPMSEASCIMQLADVLLIHLQPKPLFEFTVPSKTQAYLAMGRPILAAVGKDATDLVELAHAGMGCRPGSPESIADAVVKLSQLGAATLAQMGRSGNDYYHRELSLATGVTRWEGIFSEAIMSRHPDVTRPEG